MSTDLIKAAADARTLLRGFKAFADVATALEAAGQLDQRVLETHRALDDLLPHVQTAKAELAAAKEQAANTLAVASQQARDLVIKAEFTANGFLAAARADILASQTHADRALAERKAEMVSAAAARDGMLVKREALQAECDELEVRLIKAKNSIAKLLG